MGEKGTEVTVLTEELENLDKRSNDRKSVEVSQLEKYHWATSSDSEMINSTHWTLFKTRVSRGSLKQRNTCVGHSHRGGLPGQTMLASAWQHPCTKQCGDIVAKKGNHCFSSKTCFQNRSHGPIVLGRRNASCCVISWWLFVMKVAGAIGWLPAAVKGFSPPMTLVLWQLEGGCPARF